MKISPVEGFIKPDKIFKKVLLPAPFFPSIPIISPIDNLKFKSLNINFSFAHRKKKYF